MKKLYAAIVFLIFIVPIKTHAQATGVGSRMNEVFMRTDLAAGPTRLYDPWEITYGPDGFLWITEAKPYKVYRMDPNTGVKTAVLDLSNTGSFLPALFRRTFPINNDPWPQGGMAGLAIHPDFMNPVSPKKYVYVSYVHSYDSVSVNPNGGSFFTNWIVRFTYNTSTSQLENPVALCDTLPGSNDHNSQRMIIAKVNGVPYLFYAQGDMGAGQFNNLARTNHAQDIASYEGKILRFNLTDDGDAGLLDKWIPNDNPFNTTTPLKQSAVWATGIRNNQGFAYDSVKNILYGSSHGPYSDDEINIVERAKNYGHPRVVGYASDHNYDGAKAGPVNSSLPLIYNELKYASDTIGAAYRDPIYSFYQAPGGSVQTPAALPWSVQYIYTNQFYAGPPAGNAQDLNQFWSSEAISGLDVYNYSNIPGWKNSLLSAALKGGKILRLNLSGDGLSVIKTAPYDTISYFRSVNRFRDIAFAPDGKTIFTVIDSSLVTSGPSGTNPIISQCRGCVQKYTFLGYNTVAGTSSIPSSVAIAAGKANLCENANSIVIDANNTNYWVPITDTSGNIVAEINANGNILGKVTTSLFTNSGPVREQASTHLLFLDRNITITPTTPPTSAVSIRFYLSNAEFNALKNANNSLGQSSGITAITNLSLFKNTVDCGPTIGNGTVALATSNQSAFGAGGYVLQTSTSSLATFYAASANQPPVSNAGGNVTIALPTSSVTLDGSASYDPDGNIVQVYWFQSEGPVPAVIGNNFSTITTATGLTTAGTYVFRLQVKDNNGALAYSSKTVVVTAATVNQPPVSNAGSNVTIALPTSSVTLDGSASYDPDGSIAQVYWYQSQGPVQAVIGNNFSTTTTATGLTTAGTYVFGLQVKDNNGALAYSSKTVVVTAATTNQPPVSNAGSNVTIALPTSSVALDGSASYDPDGSIAQVYWYQSQGPVQAVIGNNFSTTTTATGLTTAGTYVFGLQVKDNNGALAYSSKTVVVTAATVNQPPVSNAGGNVSITLPTSSVALDGSASYDPDGSIVQVYWYQSQGPVQAIIGNNFSTITSATGLTTAGTYVFGLQVKDNNGLLAYSSKTVTVNAAPVTTASTREATAAQITSAGNGLSKTGNGSSQPSITAVIAPNPVANGREVTLFINSSKAGVVMVNTYSANGAIIGTKKVNLVAGINTTNVNTAGLAQGFHVINIAGGSKPVNLKLIIQ